MPYRDDPRDRHVRAAGLIDRNLRRIERFTRTEDGQSLRNTAVGSTRVAGRAAMTPAASATPITSSAAPPSPTSRSLPP